MFRLCRFVMSQCYHTNYNGFVSEHDCRQGFQMMGCAFQKLAYDWFSRMAPRKPPSCALQSDCSRFSRASFIQPSIATTRLSFEGWVDMNCGTDAPPAWLIRSHSCFASLGSKHACAINKRPMWSASVSCIREYASLMSTIHDCR